MAQAQHDGPELQWQRGQKVYILAEGAHQATSGRGQTLFLLVVSENGQNIYQNRGK
jgi:hypothetical protein